MKYFVIRTGDSDCCGCCCYSEQIRDVLKGPKKYKLAELDKEFTTWLHDKKNKAQIKAIQKKHGYRYFFSAWLIECKGFKLVTEWEDILL